jgi:hypothetical protein
VVKKNVLFTAWPSIHRPYMNAVCRKSQPLIEGKLRSVTHSAAIAVP